MKQITLEAIKSLLEIDRPRTLSDVQAVITILADALQAKDDPILPFGEVARRFKCTVRNVHYLVASGLLNKVFVACRRNSPGIRESEVARAMGEVAK